MREQQKDEHEINKQVSSD
ncbi:hypothetical protein BLA29_014089 [Euroglyphus maynei]|uniref:Uncharacterized protein n=1 Tax=Euroglyphus maynei TaxID=6958 RepID=A0A1Y3BHB4_EURMA|nr:hypothetical protein BLA29_014089 [Euroglyphus maynei]